MLKKVGVVYRYGCTQKSPPYSKILYETLVV